MKLYQFATEYYVVYTCSVLKILRKYFCEIWTFLNCLENGHLLYTQKELTDHLHICRM